MGASITVVREGRIDPTMLRRLADTWFEGAMVKYVVDVARRIVAVGGEMHADAEAVLLADGSRQDDLWGANYYPGRGSTDSLEYTSLINISPRRGNRAMELQDPTLRETVRSITRERIGEGESV
jgi:hypothetical protein